MPRREYSSPLLNYTHEFQELHPHIEIVFLPWVDEDGLTDVASGKVDCAFVGYDIQAEAARTPNAVGQIAYDRREILLWVDRGDSLASQTTVHPDQVANRAFAIPANQKNESWRVMMQSFSQIIGTGITIDEKYCDSLEDFLMNRVGSHDLVVNNREIFEMPGVNMRRDRILLPFDPPLTMPLPIAYTSQTGNAQPGKNWRAPRLPTLGVDRPRPGVRRFRAPEGNRWDAFRMPRTSSRHALAMWHPIVMTSLPNRDVPPSTRKTADGRALAAPPPARISIRLARKPLASP